MHNVTPYATQFLEFMSRFDKAVIKLKCSSVLVTYFQVWEKKQPWTNCFQPSTMSDMPELFVQLLIGYFNLTLFIIYKIAVRELTYYIVSEQLSVLYFLGRHYTVHRLFRVLFYNNSSKYTEYQLHLKWKFICFIDTVLP